jgi:hypothetical protein
LITFGLVFGMRELIVHMYDSRKVFALKTTYDICPFPSLCGPGGDDPVETPNLVEITEY